VKFRRVLALVMIVVFMNVVEVRAAADWEYAMNRSLDWLEDALWPHPAVGSVGGEWAILALARAGRIEADAPRLRGWFAQFDRLLAEADALAARGYDINNPPSAGTFPSPIRRWVDFQRITLALTALGIDAANYHGRDLTAVFGRYVSNEQRHSPNRTVNANIFALIALNSAQYEGDRGKFAQALLDAQRPDGSWGLNPATASSANDIDITAMAVQALEYGDAVRRGLDWLFAQHFNNPENTAQMIVALAAHGMADAAGYYVAWLLRWFDAAAGAFRRPNPNSLVNFMATEQAAYALVAYWRLVNEKTSLFDMSDVHGSFDPAAAATRADFAALINRELGIAPRVFNDIPEGAVSRQNAAIMITRAARLIGIDTNLTNLEIFNILGMFDDGGAAANLARGPLAWVLRAGILSGRESYIFPASAINRAESAEMVYRLMRLGGRL